MPLGVVLGHLGRALRPSGRQPGSKDMSEVTPIPPPARELPSSGGAAEEGRRGADRVDDKIAGSDFGRRSVLATAREARGPGWPASISPSPPLGKLKIFVPFFTTKRQGSGVGLTLVRQIATAHDATVDVSNTPGGGATVSLRF